MAGLKPFDRRAAGKAIALLFCAYFMVSVSSPAQAQEAEAIVGPKQAAIQAVIELQLSAFRRDDRAEAFSYASPAIRGKFRSADNFMAMVRRGYAAVHRPVEVDFLEARSFQGVIAQAVRFVGPDGRTVIAVYMMERQPDGRWLIDGVQITPIAETTS